MLNPYIVFISILLLSSNVYAWNAVGHRVIAEIAYEQLTPKVKTKVDALTAVMFHSPYPDARFMRAAIWPDKHRFKNKSVFYWHFIDMPIIRDGVSAKQPKPENVTWSIPQAERMLQNNSAIDYERAKNLSFLIHFFGDIHQPLHCAELFSHTFVNGDEGGNLYRIQSPVGDNLHQFWDRGAGLFLSSPGNYQFHYQQIQQIAQNWMRQYPRQFFAAQLKEESSMQWAQDSHRMAQLAYTTPMDAAPSNAYVQQSQTVVRERVVLAGDRLADVLNRIL